MDSDLQDLKNMFPSLTDTELSTARENIERYLAVAWEICQLSIRSFDDGKVAAYDQRKVDSQQT